MKPALVLGLALAASAMTADSGNNNELFVAPQGKLAELAKKYPGMIMFDEQADDEFYRGNLPRETFKSDEEYKRYIVKRSAEEADDEFLIRPLVPHISADDEELFVAPQGQLAELAKKWPGLFKLDQFETEKEWLDSLNAEHDGELVAVEISREKCAPMIAPKIITIRIPSWVIANDDEVTDDELLTFDQHGQEKTTIRFPGWTIQARDDEVTDDELLTFDRHDQEKTTIRIPSWTMHFDDDEVTDDESFGPHQPGQNSTIIIPGWTLQVDDEIADDQLLGSNESGPKNQPDQNTQTIIIHHWAMQRRDDEVADDELASRTPRVIIDRHSVKPAKNHTSEALVRDDEADDELVYLGQLLKDQVPRPFRGFDDDEFRAKGDKPAHVKVQEMGTEGPRMKRKLRPVVDGTSLAQN